MGWTGPPATNKSLQERAAGYYEMGKQLLFTNRYQEAADKLRQAIVLYPTAGEYFALGVTEYSMGDFGNAIIALRAVGKSDPTPKEAKNAEDLLAKIKVAMEKQGMKFPDQ